MKVAEMQVGVADLADGEVALVLAKEALLPFVLWWEEGVPPEGERSAMYFKARDALTAPALARAVELDRARRAVCKAATAHLESLRVKGLLYSRGPEESDLAATEERLLAALQALAETGGDEC